MPTSVDNIEELKLALIDNSIEGEVIVSVLLSQVSGAAILVNIHKTNIMKLCESISEISENFSKSVLVHSLSETPTKIINTLREVKDNSNYDINTNSQFEISLN